MTIKEQLRELLIQNKGKYLSGEEIAKQLYCTRGAIWKAINSLRAEGCKISAATNRGYCLDEEADIMSEQGIRRLLTADVSRVIVMQTVDSTNACLRRLAQEGAAEGTVVAAAEQTNGCGRRGRRFFSPSDTGLYLSILLRPSFGAQDAVRLTAAAAAAVCLAIEEAFGKCPEIKWVNDIFLGGKKVAGILTEASLGLENGAVEYAVVGIGINAAEPRGGFPNELSEIAGAVLEKPLPEMRNKLAAAVVNRFMQYYSAFPKSDFLEEYRRRLMWCGERVFLSEGAGTSGSVPAVMLGVDDSCRLLVRYEVGSEAIVSSGEISVRAADD